jgi:hypothetical protein
LVTSTQHVRFQVLTAASVMFRVVFWDILPCKMIPPSSGIPDDGGSTHLWNVGRQSFYTAVYPERQLWRSTQHVFKHQFFFGYSWRRVSTLIMSSSGHTNVVYQHLTHVSELFMFECCTVIMIVLLFICLVLIFHFLWKYVCVSFA